MNKPTSLNVSESLYRLREFIHKLVRARIKTTERYRAYKARHKAELTTFMEDCFAYRQEEKMPPVLAVVYPFFHPTLPLIGLNYSQVAHHCLHVFKSGWTDPLRLCRGIVFDRRGRLVAKPFDKFFNVGEHAETKELPDEPFTATVKHDGHLGIIFEYGGKLLLTTRGNFSSPSSLLGNELLAQYASKHDWASCYPRDITTLVEIIHPETEVFLKYGGAKKLIVIGACNRRNLHDFSYEELGPLSASLGLPLTERWSGNSLADLRALTQDVSVKGKEGFVVHFASGRRIKFKFCDYINLMVQDKLDWIYVMKRLMDGRLERMTKHLPGEALARAQEMADKLRKAADLSPDRKAQRQYLRTLPAAEELTNHYMSVVGTFITWLNQSKVTSS